MEPNRDRSESAGNRRQSGGGGGGGRRRSRSPVDRSRSRKERRRGGDGHPARIMVKNLPYDIKWPSIKDTFRNEVGDVAFVDLLEGPDGRSKGVAMIEFKNKDHAKKAIEKMHKFKIGDREIVVREERERDSAMFDRQREGDRDVGRDMRGRDLDMGRGLMDLGRGLDMGRGGMDIGRGLDIGRGGLDLGRGLDIGRGGLDMMMRGGMDLGRGGADLAMGVGLGLSGLGGAGLGGGLGVHGLGLGGGNMMQGNAGQMDLNPEILARLGIEGPITSQVFVANLDYQVSKEKLKEVFSLAGRVVNAELKEDKNGKSRGLGIVQFEQPLEAVQAVSMLNGQSLYERKMMVRIDKVIDEKPVSKLPSGLKSIGMGLGSGGIPLSNIAKTGGLGATAGLAGLGAGGLGAGGLGAGGLAAGGLGVGGMSSGMNLGMELGMGGLGVGMGGSGDLAGMGLNSMGMGAGGISGLGQNSAGLGGLGGSNLGLGLGDSLGSSKMDMGDGLGMSGMGAGSAMMGGGSAMMGAGGNAGSSSGMGGMGLDGSGRSGYEENRRNIYRSGGSRFDSPGRGGGFDDRQSSSYEQQGRGGLDMGRRSGLEMSGGSGVMEMERAHGLSRAGLETGLSGRGGMEINSQSRYDMVGARGGLDNERGMSYDTMRGAGMTSVDMAGRAMGLEQARSGFDQGLRSAGYDLNGRGAGGYDKVRGGDMGTARADNRAGGRQGQGRCTVTIKNIPFNLGWQDLRDRFRDIGDVKFAEIVMDQGRPSGDAVVRFGSEEDAMRAISLVDGTRLEGRTVRVVLRN